jgi:glycosyltransferase involved in cell wall biosynthesis
MTLASLATGAAGARETARPADARRRVVVSGVNLVEGGTLRILRDLVHAIADDFPDWQVDVLVHRRGLIGSGRFTEHEFPTIKRSWLRRLVFEWVDSGRLARDWAPEVWIAAHDITPRVEVPRQYVYCHNPAPFYRLPWAMRLKDPVLTLFSLFYGAMYRLNVRRNRAVIVQQDWLRQEIARRYRPRSVIVAHPQVSTSTRGRPRGDRPLRYFYPTLPRVFKNVELLCAAMVLLKDDPRWQGEVVVTIDGSESAYAASLVEPHRGVRGLRFIGLQNREQMARRYDEADALLFPSHAETWGLPLTEAKALGLPIVAADLPYAHETIGDHDRVRFIDPHDAAALAALLLGLSTGTEAFRPHVGRTPPAPFFSGWRPLLEHLLESPATPAGGAVVTPAAPAATAEALP